MVYKYLIKYTNEIGERKTYMNIGFDSRESAENELRKIKEQRAFISGKNFRIKRVSAIVFNLIFND